MNQTKNSPQLHAMLLSFTAEKRFAPTKNPPGEKKHFQRPETLFPSSSGSRENLATWDDIGSQKLSMVVSGSPTWRIIPVSK